MHLPCGSSPSGANRIATARNATPHRALAVEGHAVSAQVGIMAAKVPSLSPCVMLAFPEK